jgi:hypothetical protein
MAVRRTTLAADADDLDLLDAEARRRGVSLARVLREVVAREAEELRRQRRPTVGFVAGGSAAASAGSWQDEESPASRPFRS